MGRELVRPKAASHRHPARAHRAGVRAPQTRRDEVLALHRTIGNRAVARMFEAQAATAARATHSPPCCGDQVIQRKIGFELETGIPITDLYDDNTYGDPTNAWNEPVLGPHKLTVDHAPGHVRNDVGDFDEWPIIEFVSAPVEDDDDPADFEEEAEDWVDLIRQIRMLHKGAPPPGRLDAVVGPAEGYRKVGFVDDQSKMNDRGPNTVSVQYTFGAQLSKMNQVFQALGQVAEGTGGGKSIWEKPAALNTASTNVGLLMPTLTDHIKGYSTGFFEKKSSKQQKAQNFANQVAPDLPDIKGYLEMVSAYLVAGKTVSSRGYTKNRVTLFYKSKLSSVRNDLVAQNAYASTMFSSKKNRSWLKKELIRVNNRKAGEDTFLENGKPTVSQWLDQIFTGTEDDIFEQAKNPWSDEIKPGTVGGGLAAVMEMRSPGVVFRPNAAFNLVGAPEAIVAYLRQLFEANQRAQNLDNTGTGTDTDSSSDTDSDSS